MKKRFKVLTLLVSILVIISSTFVFAPVGSAQLADPAVQGQIRINCGSVSGYMQEQYLYTQSGSTAATEKYNVPTSSWNDWAGGHMVTKRWADGNGYFTYRIPVSPSTAAPLYLSMVTKGEVKLSVDGSVLLNTGNSGEGTYTAREFTLGNGAAWSDGYIEVKFEDADPVDGWGPNIYWIELGKSSPWRERAKHILWDTSDVIWQTGYYDGYGNEFKGTTRDFTVGNDIAAMAKDGTVYIRWNQTVASGKKYYLLTGIIGGTGTNYIDIGNNGSNEISRGASRERVYDLDVTGKLQQTGNVVKIQMASGATLDFVALVEVTPGYTTDNDLRVVFKGNEMAQNWTKLVNETMYWNNDFFIDKGTGFVDASLFNGIFANSFWVSDAAPAALEMAKWGYYDLAKQATNYKDMPFLCYTDSAVSDNGAAGIMMATMAYLMKVDNYTGEYTNNTYSKLKKGLDYYCTQIDNNTYNLILGNNWETTSDGYGIYNNSIAYFALLAGVETAGKMGNNGDKDNWSSHAARLYNGINTHLKLNNNISWLGKTIPGGTFRYGINSAGGDVSECHAGWFGVGSQEELYYGYKGNAVPGWKLAVDSMIDYHSENYWADWKAYGHNRGFGTDYGVLSERGGWPLNAMLISDRMDMAKKNLDHIIWNSTDLNFADDNEGVQETSPWVLVREVDKDDDGITGADVGNGGEVEDMNLVEYVITMKNVRLMAGADDSLSGSNNLVIIPRIPRSWEGVKVNQWPIVYKNASGYGKTKVTYDYSINPVQGSIAVSAANPVTGVQFRFGPFEKNANVSSVTANGSAATYTVEDSGDSRWIWVTQDIGTSSKSIVVNMNIPGLYANDNFNDGDLSGWTSSGGTWSNQGTNAQVVTAGDAWNTFGTAASDLSLSADVKILSGNAVGLTFRNNGTGSSGYDLILDTVDNKLKLVKRPYVELASIPVRVKPKRTYTLKAEAVGSNIRCYLDGVKAFECNDSSYTSGKFGMFGYSSTAQADNLLAIQAGFTTNMTGWSTISGTWTNVAGGREGRSTGGDIFSIAAESGTDFTYEGDIGITKNGSSGAAGALVFRGNTTLTQGYAVNITTENGGQVKLFKYPYVPLATHSTPISLNRIYHIRVVTAGSNIKVYFNYGSTPVIDMNDTSYTGGRFGLCSWNGTSVFQNITKQ